MPDSEEMLPNAAIPAVPRDRDVGRMPLGGVAKRALDLLLIAIASPILLLVGIVVAVLIRLERRGPVLCARRRIGFGGREFDCLGFRTTGAGGDPAPCLAPRSGYPDPPTTVGPLLRRLGLDQLPQFLNVLRGEMSLVGPCPVAPEELAIYGAAAGAYLGARPGLTGLWQTGGRDGAPLAERVRLDQRYAVDWSLLLDLRTLLATVPVALLAPGAD